jgi:hypothetical protein
MQNIETWKAYAHILTQRVACLQHEALDDSVKYDIIIVLISGMSSEVFYCSVGCRHWPV